MRELTDNSTDFHFGPEVFMADASLCWPSTALGRYYSSFPAAMRACLGLEKAVAKKGQSVKLDEMYESNDHAKVFLEENKFLADLLNEAAQSLRSFFGDAIKVRLELRIDPEHAADTELFARILTSLSPKEALARLDRFDNDWWLDASPRSKYYLNFTLKYI